MTYGEKLIQAGFGDLLKLCRLNDDQLAGLLTRLHAHPGHAKILVGQLTRKRIELLRA